MVIAAFWPVRRRKPPTAHPGPATKARVAPAPSPRCTSRECPWTDDDDDDERTPPARPFFPLRPRRLSARGVTPATPPPPGPPYRPSGGDQYPSRLPLSTSRHVTFDPPRTRASSPGANSDASNSTEAEGRPAPRATLDPDPLAFPGSRAFPRVSLRAFPETFPEVATPCVTTGPPCIDPVGPVSIRFVVDDDASESRSESESTPMSSSSSSFESSSPPPLALCGRS
mmetsp:Transcript_12152/g.47179  ORF Transcript_12152/g.47179 Transcript_12152/m.47179 type:complete len:227 (-) Transcript_12152:487-1167(-)